MNWERWYVQKNVNAPVSGIVTVTMCCEGSTPGTGVHVPPSAVVRASQGSLPGMSWSGPPETTQV